MENLRGLCVRPLGGVNLNHVEPWLELRGVADEVELGAFATGLIEYLAARDYCLITGRTDEASVWDQRYNAEAENKRIRRRAVMPRRAWLA